MGSSLWLNMIQRSKQKKNRPNWEKSLPLCQYWLSEFFIFFFKLRNLLCCKSNTLWFLKARCEHACRIQINMKFILVLKTQRRQHFEEETERKGKVSIYFNHKAHCKKLCRDLNYLSETTPMVWLQTLAPYLAFRWIPK